MQGLRTARARELLQACRLQGSQGPAHAPAAAAAPPVVSGADERRGEKYTRGSSAAAAAGWPASHCSAVAPRGSGTCAPGRTRPARPVQGRVAQSRPPGRCCMRSHAARQRRLDRTCAVRRRRPAAGRAAEQVCAPRGDGRGCHRCAVPRRRDAAGQAAKQASHLNAQQPARAVRVAALRAPHRLAQPLQRLTPVQLRPAPRLSGRAGREPAAGRRSLALAADASAARCCLSRTLPYFTRGAGSLSARPGAAPHRKRQRVDQADLDRRVARGQVCAARQGWRRGGRLRGHRGPGACMAARAPPCGGRVTAGPGAPAAVPAPKQQHRSLLIACAAAPARNIHA